MPGGLTAVDWAILVLYALGTVVLGYAFGRRQKTTREYFTGSGRMSPILIGFSMFATLLSTISYLAVPGEAISKGPGALVNFLAYPFAYLVVAFAIIPVYMRSRVTSAYELLEERLGLGVRLLGSGMFILVRLIWMSLLIYLSARAMTVMMGVDESWIPLVTLLTGLVAVSYTALGGLRVVVITDTLQTLLMWGGAWLAIGLVTWNLGGFGWVPAAWQPHWDVQPFFSFDPGVRISILGSIFYVFVLTVCIAGGDQTMVQRFMATRDASAARRAYLTHLIVTVVILVSLWMVGFALLGFFQEFPGESARRDGSQPERGRRLPLHHRLYAAAGRFGAGRRRHVRRGHVQHRFRGQFHDGRRQPGFLGAIRQAPRERAGANPCRQDTGLRHRGPHRGGQFLSGAGAGKHLGGHQQDFVSPGGAHLRALRLCLLHSFRQAAGGLGGDGSGYSDSRVGRLLRAPLRHGSGDGRGPGQLHVGGAVRPGRGPLRRDAHQLLAPPAEPGESGAVAAIATSGPDAEPLGGSSPASRTRC